MGSDYCVRAVVSLGAKLNNRDSPRDKTLHVKGGYLLLLKRRVTLLRESPCKQALKQSTTVRVSR